MMSILGTQRVASLMLSYGELDRDKAGYWPLAKMIGFLDEMLYIEVKLKHYKLG